MIGTEFLKGQGLGNQLFVYVTSRCLAIDRGCEFGTASQQNFAMNIHNDRGMYFMDVDLGKAISDEEKSRMKRFDEGETRLYLGTSPADMTRGIYVTGSDPALKETADNTLIYGNLQDQSYFIHHLPEIKQWLKVKPEYDSMEYSRDDLCIINVRGGEYCGSPSLFIGSGYYKKAMAKMRQINPDMKFMIITDDERAASRILPGIEAHHFDMGKDYVTVKNAKYLIMSNSSFAILPTHTSDTLVYAIAPKYWARYNVSDGFWASEQNIYDLYHYMDRKGRIFTGEECRRELQYYKDHSARYKKSLVPASGIRKTGQLISIKWILAKFWSVRIINSLKRRIDRLFHK